MIVALVGGVYASGAKFAGAYPKPPTGHPPFIDAPSAQVAASQWPVMPRPSPAASPAASSAPSVSPPASFESLVSGPSLPEDGASESPSISGDDASTEEVT
jgi:hypothetical protein